MIRILTFLLALIPTAPLATVIEETSFTWVYSPRYQEDNYLSFIFSGLIDMNSIVGQSFIIGTGTNDPKTIRSDWFGIGRGSTYTGEVTIGPSGVPSVWTIAESIGGDGGRYKSELSTRPNGEKFFDVLFSQLPEEEPRLFIEKGIWVGTVGYICLKDGSEVDCGREDNRVYVSPVPLPASGLLLGFAILALGAYGHVNRRGIANSYRHARSDAQNLWHEYALEMNA